MRHKNQHRKFGRDFKHVKAMMRYLYILIYHNINIFTFHYYRNLVTNLVKHDRITTTLAKAKELRPLADKVIQKAK